MIRALKKDNIKLPSFRISGCGIFPNYQLNGVSFSQKNIIYLVSVGKDKFKNKWVERFVNFVEEVKPQKTFIVIADTLQRFNIEVDENLDYKQAFIESINKGQEWIKKYKPSFSRLNINYEFVHWETLKKDKDFEHYFHEIKKLDERDSLFKAALAISSKEYINRPSRVSLCIDHQKAEINSRAFLIEECAVFQVLAKNKDNLVIVYPGPITDVLAMSIQHINDNYREKENPFYWRNLRPTKNKKNIESKAKESIQPLFFRSISLNETQLPSYQVPQDLDKKTAFFRRSSLDSYSSKEKPPNISSFKGNLI